MCLFLGSVGVIIVFIVHSLVINPLLALIVVCYNIPRFFLIEYHRRLLVADNNAADGGYEISDTADSAWRPSATSTGYRPIFATSSVNPEEEELYRFLDFQRLQRRNRQQQSGSLSNSSDSTSESITPIDTQEIRRRVAGLNRLPPVDPSARLPVVLNYRRRDLPTDTDTDTEHQVDDPLTYFSRRTFSGRIVTNMTPSSKSRKSYTAEEWDKVVNDMNVSFQDLNSLILNYLVVEGYQDAARKFAKESKSNMVTSNLEGFALPYGNGTSDQALFNSVHDRMVIKNLIHTGQIQPAIEKINDIDPELLDTHAELHFSLLRLQLIELIRACNYPSTLPKNSPVRVVASPGDIAPALEFAISHLARRAPANPKFLVDLERTMALLCFPPDDKNLLPELRSLMDIKLRQSVAREVNTIILARQGISGDPKMTNLVKLWAWAEQELTKEKVAFPRLDRSCLG